MSISAQRFRLIPRVQALGERLRSSLQLRVVVSTLGLASVAVLLTGVAISYSVSASLFDSQLRRVLDASSQAMMAARSLVESSDAADPGAMQSLMSSALRAATATSGTDLVAVYRVPDQAYSELAPQDRVSTGLSGTTVSSELRARLQKGADAQYWQSVSLPDAKGVTGPGIVVGSMLRMPSTAGSYEVYLGYPLGEAAAALGAMQAIGIAGASALVLLLAAVLWFIVRWLLRPITRAAEMSARLARGALEVRLPASGSDELATLATSFNDMADSLQSQIGELAELSTMQQRFVSDVSHELRTPLTTIRLAGEVLYSQRDEFDGPTKRTVELLRTETERFEQMLGDLLEISRYDAGSVALQVEPTNLVHLVDEVIQGMRLLAEGRGSTLRFTAPGGHIECLVDPRRVRRVVRNLVGNAIEHGEGKPIDVTVDSSAQSVSISVRDYGIGMTDSERERVFDRFWRADPARTRTLGGTGLGLAISREDALAHGGTIDLWSAPRAGSQFVLTVPRKPGARLDTPSILADGGRSAVDPAAIPAARPAEDLRG